MTELSVRMMEMDDVSMEADVDPKTYEKCTKYDRLRDEAEFGYAKGEPRVRKQTDSTKSTSSKNRAKEKRLFMAAYAIRKSENVHAN